MKTANPPHGLMTENYWTRRNQRTPAVGLQLLQQWYNVSKDCREKITVGLLQL